MTIGPENRRGNYRGDRRRVACITNAVYNGLMIYKKGPRWSGVEEIVGEYHPVREIVVVVVVGGEKRVYVYLLLNYGGRAHRSLFKIQFGPDPFNPLRAPFDFRHRRRTRPAAPFIIGHLAAAAAAFVLLYRRYLLLLLLLNSRLHGRPNDNSHKDVL